MRNKHVMLESSLFLYPLFIFFIFLLQMRGKVWVLLDEVRLGLPAGGFPRTRGDGSNEHYPPSAGM